MKLVVIAYPFENIMYCSYVVVTFISFSISWYSCLVDVVEESLLNLGIFYAHQAITIDLSVEY